MQDNPFATLAKMLKPDDEYVLRLYRGTVLSETPLNINIAGIEVTDREIMLNKSLENGLEVNDTVLALSDDDQLFYIICKVVRPS